MEKKRGINSFTLHILAMLFMLCDHLWATLFPAQEWLTCIGRLAFPIFAFMIAEGCYYTSNVKKYMQRLFLFAVISEIPFNLIMGSSVKAKKKQKQWILLLIICLVLFMDYLLGNISMVDYNAAGILTVLLFYFFRKKTWVSFVAQFAGMYYLNVVMLGDLYYPVTILGHHFEIPQQSFALLALIPIWLYNREQGYHSKWFKYFCYAFYPAHLLILFIIWQWHIR